MSHRIFVNSFLMINMYTKQTITFIFFVFLCFSSEAQVRQFDKLEMLFAQQHYKRVYRKANNLLDKPEFDYSMMPKYYKSISIFQLAQNAYWLKRHPRALDEAQELFLEVKHSTDGEKLFNAHMYEITWLKSDMTTWASDLKRMGYQDEFLKVQQVMARIFDGMPDIEIPGNVTDEVVADNPPVNSGNASSDRMGIVDEAKEHIGVPYVWAGNSPSGFDCSGFTSYVMKQEGVELPRRSSDQYSKSQKVKPKNVQEGDLVFFNNGSGISHVGIVISGKGEPLVMIHSSSSKGIIVTEVEKSEYWMKRLHGFGTYVN